MTSNLGIAGTMKGHDAMHRARKRDTHPTHACSEDFCGFRGARKARSFSAATTNVAIAPFQERASSARGRW